MKQLLNQKIRYRLKHEIEAVFQALLKYHHEKLVGTEEEMVTVLAECQQAAIAVGNKLETVLEEHRAVVSLLEEYCEQLYQVTQDLEHINDHIEILDGLIQKVWEQLKGVQGYYQITFMPYKASMWDSLESIYLAAKKDPECQCLVVPIPYYDLDEHQQKSKLMYEGDQFPADIPITRYQDYDLNASMPDVIYIHYPYDEYNRVTNIHPDYCSYQLKKYTDCLVYVPYYVTSGFFSEEHRRLPVYRSMDYMIAQSEHFKEEAKGLTYYDKILPLGSPKLDRVIRICRGGRNIPAEWADRLEGKKTVMLNTSLNCILADTEAYLKKLKTMFQYFRTRSDIGLIWRPHPLLETTIQSMRPKYEGKLKSLVKYFQANRIGVLDQTPDLTATIAISDAYMGENSSSVINLFGAAGKPLFILNNYVFGPFTEAEKRRLWIIDLERVGDSWWILNGLGMFRVKEEWDQAEYVGHVPAAPLWTTAYNGMTLLDGKLYLAPLMASDMAVFCPDGSTFKTIPGPNLDGDYKLRKVIPYGRRLLYLPQDYPAIWEYSIDTGEWKEYRECMLQWRECAAGSRYEDVYDGVIVDHRLWMTASYSNFLLNLDLETGDFRFLELGQKGLGYSAIIADGRNIWVAEVHTGALVQLDLETRRAEAFSMPEGFKAGISSYGRRLAHIGLVDLGDFLVTAPGFSNYMVKLDKRSGKTSLLRPDLWNPPAEDVNGYSPRVSTASGFIKASGSDQILVTRTWDMALLEIDVRQETAVIHYPRMTQESLRKIENLGDGFEKIDTVAEFSRKENIFFSLEEFLDDLVSGRLENVKERQREALKTLAANLDGTCGEKVHECIKEKCKYRTNS